MKIKYLSILPVIAVFVLSGFSFAHAQSDVFTQNLYYGLQNNSQVTQLQEFLTSQNLYSGPITGNFYFLTLGAVKAFQTQQGVTPAAGYFGPITMAAANKIADAVVSASNNEAITETGTSTPPVVTASTTPQLQLAALTQELALLEQQLQAQQSSTQALQQIAQNTTPPVETVPTPTPTQPQGSTPTPTVSIMVNGSANSITIPYGSTATISWSSTNANSCNVSPMGWSGASGNQSTGSLTTSQTYSISCTGTGGSTSASLTVSVSAAPVPTTLGSIQLTGANDGTNQFYTGIEDNNLSVKLFDENGNPITTASATISTDDPNPSGIGFGNYANDEFETNSTNGSTFTITNPAFHNGYIFGYEPQTTGQHTITVSALGSTRSITVTSQTPPPPPQPTVSLIPPQSGYIGNPQTSAVVASLACQYPNSNGVYSYSYSPNLSSLTYEVNSTDFTANDLSLTTTGNGANGSCVNVTLNPLPSTGGTFQLEITGLQFVGGNGGSSTNALGLPITTAEFQVDAPNTITLWTNNTIGGGATSASWEDSSPLLNPANQVVYGTRVYIGGHTNATLQVSWTGSNPANNLAYFYVPCNSDGCNPAPAPIQTTSPNGGTFPIALTPGYNYAMIFILTPTTIINTVPQTYASPSNSTLNATLLLQ